MSRDTALSIERFRTLRACPRDFEIAYTRQGEGGAPLLLIHGWPETRRIWWRNLEPLAAAGFDVIAPDLRGFGESAIPPDGFGDAAAHSADLYALLHETLRIERVSVVAGDLGGAVAQDLSLRFPGFVERLVLFNCPLPYSKQEMRDLRTRPPVEMLDYFIRQGTDADRLAAELDSVEKRRAYVASFYTSRGWAAPGALSPPEVEFLTEPFGDGARLREGFKTYESALDAKQRSAPLLFEKNPTPALLLFGLEDHVVPPDWDAMAICVFPDHMGPLRLPGTGHFVQWEAAPLLNGAIARLLAPTPRSAWPDPEIAYVALGSNLGSRERHLCAAVAALRATLGVRDVVVSPVYETRPLGPGEQRSYLNAVARLETRLSPRALLDRLLCIERAEGRLRGAERNTARTLDLDLLLHGQRRSAEPGLQLPHPRLHERAFVLEPLRDLAPRLLHPLLGQPIEALAARVRDPAGVRRRDADTPARG
jgi:2-amino-4-hydroxy-6-hydroxymethyldihydropteridine diphosphokinase